MSTENDTNNNEKENDTSNDYHCRYSKLVQVLIAICDSVQRIMMSDPNHLADGVEEASSERDRVAQAKQGIMLY